MGYISNIVLVGVGCIVALASSSSSSISVDFYNKNCPQLRGFLVEKYLSADELTLVRSIVGNIGKRTTGGPVDDVYDFCGLIGSFFYSMHND